MDNLLTYFAYGSNLSSPRLQARTPSAEVIGRGVLDHHRLRFNKRGSDQSAKCSFDPAAGDVVHGVLYRIRRDERAILDHIEGVGRGYDVLDLSVRRPDGSSVTALTYRASESYRIEGLRPFDWYVEHVMHGMIEHGIARHCLADVLRTGLRRDPDSERAKRERAIYTEGQRTQLRMALAQGEEQA